MARAFADAAVDDRFFLWADAAIFEIDFRQLGRGFEGAVVVCGRFPRDALRARDVAAAQNAFLRILGHVRDLAFEFAG